ncbi:MAG: AAA family ATPase [Sulfuriferula sp.]
METKPRVLIIAGPNGAGKTTFAREFLLNEAHCPVFVNADLIAAGLAPFAPETAALRAARLMLNELVRLAAARVSFAFETTLAGRGYLRLIRQWQLAGYHVGVIFLQLDTPETVIRRRFVAGQENFAHRYAPAVDFWVLYDNAGERPVLLDWSEKT